ncbi:MAG: phosphotransferase [Bacilli bacterium]|nr:phosphotransferase [Bacilli bacterium]
MRFHLENQTLTLYFEGELNSYNAAGVEKEAFETVHGKEFKTLVLDLEHLSYISSAGLRIVLKLKQKYNDVSAINCSLEVYDIFNMTGFTNIMPVKKALKRVYVSGAEVIGQGFFSTVYRLDKDTIIKVFNRVSDPEQVERELRLAKEAFILGIPTAISFDIVKVDDKLGVRFEMLDCMSLRDVVVAHPEKAEEYLNKYVALLKKINTTECENPEIPDIKAFTLQKLETIKPYLDQAHYEKAKKMLKGIPNRKTFVHGDCHFKNIMVQNEELILIDMDTLSVGHPIFEFAALYAPYCAFDEDDPGNSLRFLKVDQKVVNKLYNELVDRTFTDHGEDVKNKIRIVSYIHMVWWNRLNEPQNNVRMEGCRGRLYELLDRYDDLIIPYE